MTRTIWYVSGTRADYGLMKKVLYKLNAHPNINLGIIITGMHLQKKFGLTYKLIKKDGFKIVKLIPVKQGHLSDVVSITAYKFSNFFKNHKPDILLVEGDRSEIFGAVYAANMHQIPIAHVSGGDVSGNIDNLFRYSITLFSHIHFVGTKESRRRLLKFGEEEFRIHLVGSPINLEYDKTKGSKDNIEKIFDLDLDKKIILVLQHPVTGEENNAGNQIRKTLNSIKKSKYQAIIIYPNNDPGNELMIEEIEKERDNKQFRIVRNIPSDLFMGLLNNVSLLIGNSSCSIVEAPFFNLPVINVGNRQKNRERGNNVFDVDYDEDKIFRLINKTINLKKCKIFSNPYNVNKKTEIEIPKILSEIEVDSKLMSKRLLL